MMATITNAIRAIACARLFGVAMAVVLVGLVSPAFAGHGPDQWAHKGPRFQVLVQFGGTAVLDRETGLVWEKSPNLGAFTWLPSPVGGGSSGGAHDHCNRLVLGERMGWRVPTIQELTSLLDQSVPGFVPHLTPGHPFAPLWSIGEHIWSATTDANNAGQAWTMELLGSLSKDNKSTLSHVWCVRLRQGVDPQ